MGYTHYMYYKKKELDKDAWENFVTDMILMYKNLPEKYGDQDLLIGGSGGDSSPIFDYNEICFNDKNFAGEDFELFRTLNVLVEDNEFVKTWKTRKAFELEQEGELFAFCKTNEGPYDLLCQIALILAKFHFGDDLRLESDGGEEGLAAGKKIVKDLIGIDLERILK